MSGQAHMGRTLSESTPVFDQAHQPVSGAPNVVMVVLDDLGFADFGCYGSPVSTPHVDALAEQGLRFNNFHVTAICSPTRACLLTGRNQHRVGMGFFPDIPLGFPGYTGRIPASAGTLPRVLRDAGYNTFAVGKWHLTPRLDRTAAGPFDRWPLGVGFQRYYGFLGALTSQWHPDLVRDNGFIDQPAPADDGYHLTEDLASQAIRFVQDQQHAAPNNPFFLYFATGAMHAPHQVAESWMEEYRGRFDTGWESMRQHVFARQQELGVVPPGITLSDRPPWVADWDELSADERRVFARQMELYAGFLAHTDAQIGRLIDFLDRIDVLDNTLVMVLSDNGASGEGGPSGVLNQSARSVESMIDRLDEFGGVTAQNHYAWGWTWAGNTPFKLWKRYSWLGGVRTPLIVRWPAGMSSGCYGQVRGQFCHAIDLMPTILAAAGLDAPKVIDGVSQQSVDGASILATLDDADSPSPRDTQYFETLGSRSIYHNGWKATTDHIDATFGHEGKLIAGSNDFDTDRWSLYHLDRDFAESDDLADSHPALLQRMVELWWHEAGRNQVLPLVHGFSEQATAAMQPPPHPDRHQWVFRPGGGPIITPSPFRTGFRLLADIEVANERELSGVICAHHNHGFGATSHGGWACHIAGGRLLVTFNRGGSPVRIVSRETDLTGRHQIQIAYEPRTDHSATIHVSVDSGEPATHTIRSAPAARFAEAKLLIGRDEGIPITDDYNPPSPFTGQIYQITYTTSQPQTHYTDINTTLQND